jgi:hypothetical protein
MLWIVALDIKQLLQVSGFRFQVTGFTVRTTKVTLQEHSFHATCNL